MRVIGFNFTKISADRKTKLEKLEKINTNIEFLNVELDKVELMKEQNALKVHFKYTIEYEPKNAELVFEGLVLIQTPEDKAKEIQKDWKKKQIKDEIKIPLFNLIMQKCTLKALQAEEDLGLPLHIKFPKIQKKIE